MKRLSTDFDATSVNKMPRMADGHVENERRLCFKFLAPAHLAASIMGPKGKIIQAIQGETNTTIQFSDRGFNYATTRSRLATVIGNRTEDLFGAMLKVIEHVHQCIAQQAEQGNAPHPDSDQLSADNQVFIMIIPKIMRGVVIGPGGAQVAELRQLTGCKIRLDEGMTPSESMVKIEGAPEGILKVCQWIIEQIENVCDDESFRLWIKGHGNISTRDGIKQINKQSRQVDNNMPRARNPLGDARGEDALNGYSNFITPKDTIGRASARTPNNSGVSNMATPNMSAIIEKVGAEVNFGEKTFSLQLPIPLDFKGALIGKGGHGVKEILHEAHCASLNVQDIPGTEDCTVRIEGSVMACSAAYLLVMRRYAIYARQRQHAIDAANRQLQQ